MNETSNANPGEQTLKALESARDLLYLKLDAGGGSDQEMGDLQVRYDKLAEAITKIAISDFRHRTENFANLDLHKTNNELQTQVAELNNLVQTMGNIKNAVAAADKIIALIGTFAVL